MDAQKTAFPSVQIHAKNKLSSNNLISKGFPRLCNTKGTFIRPDFLYVQEIDKIPCAVSGRKYKSIAVSAALA
jgi:hypothetical protein